MSRIGNKPVAIPASVEVTANGDSIAVKGPKGSLSLTVTGGVTFTHNKEGKSVSFARVRDSRAARSLHGLYRSLFNNMVLGVTKGYQKVLLVVGVGYRAEIKGNDVVLTVGFADPKVHPIPEGIEVKVGQQTRIEVNGIDKQKVGHFAAQIRKSRLPEPYKGKGVLYEGETIRRKAGKSFAAEGA